MADKPLKSITFPDLPDRYTIPQIDTALETAGMAADAKATGDELTDLKSAFEQLVEKNEAVDWSDLGTTTTPTGWQRGYYSTTGTVTGTTSSAFICTLSTHRYEPEDSVRFFIISAPSGYAVAAFEYLEDDSFLEKYGSADSTSSSGTARLIIRHTPGHKYSFSLGRFSSSSDAANNLTNEFVSNILLYSYSLINDVDESDIVTSDEFDGLKSIIGYDTTLSESDFTLGTIAISSGNDSTSTTRIRVELPYGVIAVRPASGYKISLYAYNAEEYIGVWDGSSFVKASSDTTFTNGEYILTSMNRGYRYRVVLAHTDDSTIDTTDYYNLIVTYDRIESLGDDISIVYDESTIGQYIGVDGTIGSSETFHYSNPVPVDYEGVYCYSFEYYTSESGFTMRIHGYDINGDWIKQICSQSHVSSPKTIRFSIDDQSIKTIKISISKNIQRESLRQIIFVNNILDQNTTATNVPVTWDANGDGYTIGEDGTANATSNFHYSDLLPVISGTYELSFWRLVNVQSRWRLHGYNANGVWVQQIQTANLYDGYYSTTFDIDGERIKYIRISIRVDATGFCLTNNTMTGALYDLHNSITDLKYGMQTGSVDLTTANAVCRCVESYLAHNSDFIYGQDGTAVRYNEDGFIDSDTGKYRIDCSSFANLVTMGVDYDHSRYNTSNDYNIFGKMGYGFNPFWNKSDPWDGQDTYGTWTWQMCYEYSLRGMTIDIINRDFSGVQPGDLIFWGNSSDSRYTERYKHIHHVNVVLGRYGEKDAIVADAGQVPINVRLASNTLTSNDIQVLARLPLGVSPINTLNVISETYDTPTTGQTYTISSSPVLYTPVAAKFRIHQISNTGSITLQDGQGSDIFAAETLNTGTNGKTFDIVTRGYTKHSDISSFVLAATGAEILSVVINYPATCVEKE